MKDSYTFTQDGKILRLAFYNKKTVHVTFSIHEEPELLTLTEIRKEPDGISVSKMTDTDDEYLVDTGYVRIRIDKTTLNILYEDNSAQQLSGEHDRTFQEYDIYRTRGGSIETRKTVDGVRSSSAGGESEFVRTSYHAHMTVDFTDNESLFGLGSHEEGFASLKGQYVPLYQENMRIAIPVFVSTKGYAYVFNCASLMTFDAADEKCGKIYFDSVDAIDYYFIAGDSFDDICGELRALFGETPLLPKWALGYIQSKERYLSADELTRVASEYRRRNIPLDCIVQDWMYWGENMWGDKHFDLSRYPDPQKMTESLHGENVRLMISIWPNMSGDSPDKKEFEKAGLLLGDGSVYDAFSERGRALYTKQAFDHLLSYGIDGWWCDSSEPYDAVWGGAERPPLQERMGKSVGEFKKYLDDSVINAYSLMHSKGIYEEQRKRTDQRVLNLTRSGFIGQHRYGTVVWSGDVSATWETLRRQVHIAQNYIASGEAYWNSDIGAFFVSGGCEWFRAGDYDDGVDNLGYRELYTRWLQFAGFTPFMRSHGTDTPREIWRFGEPGTMFYDAIEAAIRLRYKLIPYFYSVHAAVTFRGEMPIRPLALEFPNDEGSHLHTNEYMYGHELLICPITKPIYYDNDGKELKECDRTAEIYLPPCGWYDLWTERYYEGGRTVTMNIDLNNIPVFVRAGSIIPTSDVMQSASEIPDNPYEVIVFSCADGSFTLYEDAGDGYGYENGEFAMTRITYDKTSHEIREEVSGIETFKHPLRYRTVSRDC